MIIAFTLIVFLVLILLIGKVTLVNKFDKEVKELFAQSNNISNIVFHKKQLDHLPEPVQRYFNYVLKEGQPYISYVRITHSGFFKTGLKKDWIQIKGEQYATTQKPGFIWKGTTAIFIAFDRYIGEIGRLTVYILSLIKVVEGKGGNYNQGELLRWLGESIMYPTNLLPSKLLQWYFVNDTSAKFTYNYKGLSLFFYVSFNQLGQIVEMQTKRFMDENKLENWVIKVSNYKELNQVIIPTAFEVLWRLRDGDFSYAKFNITKVEYETPLKFQ